MKYIQPAWRGGRLPGILRGQGGAVWRPLLFGIPILVSALTLIAFHTAATSSSIETDFDSDGMTDAYELFFGLNSTNPADAYQDSDGDRLSNLQESDRLTDPFAPDTDRDEFNDDMDANPISRAYIQWGAPQFTTGDQYDYAHPDWVLNAYKNGGEWMVDLTTTQSFWYVSACESNLPEVSKSQELQAGDVGSLSIDLDRTILTNNLRYAVHYLDTGNSSVYVDLLDTNGEIVVEDLYGNLMEGTNAEAVVLLDVPTASFTNAAVIQLRLGKGEVVVYEGLVYIDEDGDGLDADQERQLGTSDYNVDSNGNRIGDYEEYFHKTNNVVPIDPNIDDDDDADEDKGKDKKTGVIYVDQSIGNDQFTGRACDVAGQDGPKKTIHKGMAAVDVDGAHTLVIKSGAYNENLDLRGKNVKVVIEGNVRL